MELWFFAWGDGLLLEIKSNLQLMMLFKKNNLPIGMDGLLLEFNWNYSSFLHNFLEQWKKVKILAFQRKLILVRATKQS